ncbi:MAG: hypothetical protein WB492_05040, partial [Christiangramia sp.]
NDPSNPASIEDSTLNSTYFKSDGQIIFNQEIPKNKSGYLKIYEQTSNYRLYENKEEISSDCDVNFVDVDFPIGSIYTAANDISLNIRYFYAELFSNGLSKINITVYNDNGEPLYSENLDISGSYEFGIATSEIFFSVIITHTGDQLYLLTQGRGSCPFFVNTDSDGDGINDDVDPQPNSNNEDTVVIDGCDSGVNNFNFGDGYTLSDKIDELETGNYKNHGQYVKTIAKYLNGLKKEGILTGKQKGKLMRCTGSSSI